MRVSVVIPTFNEEKVIEKSLSTVRAYLEDSKYDFKIIVVDDASTDSTVQRVRAFMEDCPNVAMITLPENAGKGAAVKSGMLSSRGDYMLFSDADLSTPIQEMEKLLKPLREGWADVSIGSRAMPGSRIEVSQRWHRAAMGKAFGFIVRNTVLPGIRDSQCGFKCFTRRAALHIFGLQRFRRFDFDVEILYLARKLGYRIEQIPVRWIHSPPSKVKLYRDPFTIMLNTARLPLIHRGAGRD